MASYARFDLLLVRFPFSERHAFKHRPGLVISHPDFQTHHHHIVLAMITTAVMTRWPSDVAIDDCRFAGLVSPSVVRLKLFTLADELVIGALGSLDKGDRRRVESALSKLLSA